MTPRRVPDIARHGRIPGTWLAAVRSRLRRAQLRTRVLAGVLTVTLIALAGFGFATVTVLHGYLLARTDSDLRTVLAEYQPMLRKGETPADSGHPAAPAKRATAPSKSHAPSDHPDVSRAPLPFRMPSVLDYYYVEVKTGPGPAGQGKEYVNGNTDLVPQLPGDLAALSAGNRGQTVTSRNGHTQLRLLAASANGKTLIVTTSLDTLNGTVRQLSLIVALGMLAAAILVFTGVSLVIRRGLRPVQAMASAADRITAGELTTRVTPDDRATEVGRLGAALNGMLARIHAAVRERDASAQAARRFLADASHELRTPLAALRANGELYQQGALARRDQVDEAMHRIVSEARRMGRLVDDMLRLARLDQHPQQHWAPVDLSALAAECADRARTADPERAWHARITPRITVDGDEEMLRRAIDNLLANVTVHTPPGTTALITVAADEGEGAATIAVSDDGLGVPADLLPRVFDRFYRTPSQSCRPGSGLGLAIADATASAHHGTAEAMLSSPHGLRISITIPAVPATARLSGEGMTDSGDSPPLVFRHTEQGDRPLPTDQMRNR